MRIKARSNTFSLIYTVAAVFLYIAVTCLFAACKHEEEEIEVRHGRTVLAYMVGENDLFVDVMRDVQEMLFGMKNAHFGKDDKLVIYVDDLEKPRIYTITKSHIPTLILEETPEFTYNTERNSASASQLAEVVDYVMKKHPNDSYGLVLGSHGSGWIPSTYPGDYLSAKRRSFAIDNGKNNNSQSGNRMNITDMARELEKRCKFDFIFFDACFMQNIETDYELRNCAKYIIGSPAEIPGPGADYSTMMDAMFEPEDYAQRIVDAYHETYCDNNFYGVIMSAVNTSALEGFAAYMKDWVRKPEINILSSDYSNNLNYFSYDKLWYKGEMPDQYDIKGLAMALTSSLPEEAYAEWEQEFNKLIVQNKFTSTWFSGYTNNNFTVIPEQCGGVSMFLPLKKYSRYGNYLESILDTEWGKLLWENYDSNLK